MLCCFVVSVSSSFIESVFYNPCRLIGHTRVAVLAFNKYIHIYFKIIWHFIPCLLHFRVFRVKGSPSSSLKKKIVFVLPDLHSSSKIPMI